MSARSYLPWFIYHFLKCFIFTSMSNDRKWRFAFIHRLEMLILQLPVLIELKFVSQSLGSFERWLIWQCLTSFSRNPVTIILLFPRKMFRCSTFFSSNSSDIFSYNTPHYFRRAESPASPLCSKCKKIDDSTFLTATFFLSFWYLSISVSNSWSIICLLSPNLTFFTINLLLFFP